MLILTDPIGDFEEFPAEDAKTPGSLSGLLFDFDIDGSKLKPKHKIWLDKAAKFMLKKGPKARWTAHIDGKASHTGGFSHNIGLSAKREQAVERELKKISGLSEPRLTINFDFKGFDESKPIGEKKGPGGVYRHPAARIPTSAAQTEA